MTISKLMTPILLASVFATPVFAKEYIVAQYMDTAYDSASDEKIVRVHESAPVATSTTTRIVTQRPVHQIAPSSGTATHTTTVIEQRNPIIGSHIGVIPGISYPVEMNNGQTVWINEPPITDSETTVTTSHDGPYTYERTSTTTRNTGPTIVTRHSDGTVSATTLNQPVDGLTIHESKTVKDRTNSPAPTVK